MAAKRPAKRRRKPAPRTRRAGRTKSRSAADFVALAEVGRLLSQALDRATVAERVVASVRDLLHLPHAVLFQVRDDGDVVVLASATARPVWEPGGTVPRDHGVVGLTLRQRRPVMVPDFLTDARVTFSPEARARLARDPDRAVLSLPLMARDHIVGVLSMRDRTGRAFSDDALRLARSFADQAAIALENASLFERQTELLVETRLQQHEALELEETARAIASTDEAETVFKRIVDLARQLCGSDVAIFAATEPPGEIARVVALAGARTRDATTLVFEVGRGPAGEVLDAGRSVVVDNYLDGPQLESAHHAIAKAEELAATAFVAVRDETGVSGLLAVANRSARAFTPRQVAVLGRLADQAGLALRKVRLYSTL
ncbi:MAG: GAF domain-containing protein, partial [Candidatus Rokubacteria bacterium]|nr:GAF domain-containing protein [Candidatus Rokubacteria bacterium]